MDTERGLQDVISRNVRVLMAVHDIRAQQDLAARLGWPPARVNKLLNGGQRWAIDDLPTLARVFGVTPAALLSDTAELVGVASHPAAVGGDRSGVRLAYLRPKHGVVVPFPQVTASHATYAPSAAAYPIHSITARQHRRLRTVVTSSDVSPTRVTRVTPAVGL